MRLQVSSCYLLQLHAGPCAASFPRSRTWQTTNGGERCRGSFTERAPSCPALPPRAPADLALPRVPPRAPAAANWAEASRRLIVRKPPGYRGHRLRFARGSVFRCVVRPLGCVSAFCCCSRRRAAWPRLRLKHGSVLGRVVRPLCCGFALCCFSRWSPRASALCCNR